METQSPAPSGKLISQTIAMPRETNANGDIFGGWLLSQMDLAGAILAGRIAQGRVATVAISSMSFLNPVPVGAVVGCYAQLKPQEIAQIEGVSVVLGANEKFNILEHLEKESSKRLEAKVAFDNIKETKEFVKKPFSIFQ